MNGMAKNLILWVVIGLVVMTVFGNFGGKRLREQPLDYTKFYQLVLQGQVEHVMLDKETAHARLRGDDKRYVVYVPETDNKALVGDLLDKGVVIEAKPPEQESVLMQIFISWFPMGGRWFGNLLTTNSKLMCQKMIISRKRTTQEH